MKWFFEAFRHYADFSGRARRKEYWMFYLFNSILSLLLLMTGLVLGLVTDALESDGAKIGVYLFLFFRMIGVLYSLAILIPSLAVQIRRLHDQEKTGWWIFISLIPLVGPIWMLVLMCMEGTFGWNRYGDDPKALGD